MKTRYIVFVMMLCLAMMACDEGFLEKKSNKSLTVPATIADFWALLDNTDVMQFTPALGQLATDDHYFKYSIWNAQSDVERNSYIWSAKIFTSPVNQDWTRAYNQVYYTNCVLEGLESISGDAASQVELNNIRGTALFMRAYTFFNLVETFSKPYNQKTANVDPGIPLRMNTDLDEKSTRQSVQKTYDQILADLREAKGLVPVAVAANKTRPSKPAVFALLARVSLSMGDYQNAGSYADSCLDLYDELLDYNNIDPKSNRPFPNNNPEVLYQSCLYNYFVLNSLANTLIDTLLLNSYGVNDIRKDAFFRKNPDGQSYFKGMYTTGPSYLFSGLATDEIYLVRAECHARNNNIALSMNDLNTLLEKRCKSGTFIPYSVSSPDSALKLILAERRKELLFRGLRWNDLRRLNQEPALAVTLTRNLNGLTYTLPPSDRRYVYPIPDGEIAMSGLQQNDR